MNHLDDFQALVKSARAGRQDAVLVFVDDLEPLVNEYAAMKLAEDERAANV
jgi:hypothetical protein